MKKRLKEIRETQRPCLEACLRFLLFADGGRRGKKPTLDSGSSSDEEGPAPPEKGKDFSSTLIRDHQNLAEPRSSQGVFGPNGELLIVIHVCWY
jgi:WD repeat-containing protein 59